MFLIKHVLGDGWFIALSPFPCETFHASTTPIEFMIIGADLPIQILSYI